MSRVARIFLWPGLIAIVLMTGLSVYCAFIGADRSHEFVNSKLMVAFWIAFCFILVAGLAVFPRLINKPGLMMMHLGVIIIFLGAMWGSEPGHRLQSRLLGINKIRRGSMIIFEKESENQVLNKQLTESIGILPFEVYLDDFRVEYYLEKCIPPILQIRTEQGEVFELEAKENAGIESVPAVGKIRIVKCFDNFRIRIEDGERIASDASGPADNPAVEVEIVRFDGDTVHHYVFEKFAGHGQAVAGLELRYLTERVKGIRDYFSDLSIVKDGKTLARKTIEVNKPLHFGGYNFYQHSYDSQSGQYTVLAVVSDTGINVVYAGYAVLCIGTVLWFWFGIVKSKKRPEPESTD